MSFRPRGHFEVTRASARSDLGVVLQHLRHFANFDQLAVFTSVAVGDLEASGVIGEAVEALEHTHFEHQHGMNLGYRGSSGMLAKTNSECPMDPKTFSNQMRQKRFKSPLNTRDQALKQFAEVEAFWLNDPCVRM